MRVSDLTVPVSSMIYMLAAALFCLIVPIAVLLWWKKKHPTVSIIPALVAAAGFFVWALVLEQLLHLLVLPYVMDTVVPYVIYGTLAAGIFEETGRFVIFKLLMKKTVAKGNPADAVMYGIGHGGFEAIFLVSMTMVSYFVIAVLMNTGNTAILFEGMTEENIALGEQQLEMIAGSGAVTYIMTCVERLIAMTVHISLTVIVFTAAVYPKKWWLYPAAILVHALFDTPVAMYQKAVISMPVMYVCITLLTIPMVIAAVKLYRSMAGDYDRRARIS